MKFCANESFDGAWVPWRIQCQSKEEQIQVIAVLTNSITVAVDESEVFVYGDLTGAAKQLASLTGLTFDRQALFCFKAPGITTPRAASEAERWLAASPSVNAAVVDPESSVAYLFVNDAMGQIRDPELEVHVSVTVNWPCFAMMNGRAVSGEPAFFLGIYPETGNILEVHNLKSLVESVFPGADTKVIHTPPSLQIGLDAGSVGCDTLCVRVAEALQMRGYPRTSAQPGRVALWHAANEELRHSTILRRTSAPSGITNPTLADLQQLKRYVETMVPGSKLRTMSHQYFLLGTSKSSVWHLPHKLKAGMLSMQSHMSAVFVNFSATHLIIATDEVTKVKEEVPQILQHLEFTIGKGVPALPSVPMDCIVEEASRAIHFNSQLAHAASAPRADFIVTALQPQGNPNVLALEEYVMLHQGMLNMLYDAETNTCFLRHSRKMSLPWLRSIFQNLACEVQITPGDQTEQYLNLLQKLKTEAKARGKTLLGEEHYDTAAEASVEDPLQEEPASSSNPDLLNDLNEKWVFYFDTSEAGGVTKPLEHNAKEVGSFDTLKGFWRYWGAFNVDNLKEGLNLRLFRAGILPTSEDPANCKGGRWVARGIPPKDRSRIWPTVVLAMVQGLLKDDFDDIICGMVLSTKAGSDSIQVWCGKPFDAAAVGDKVTVGAILEKVVSTDPADRTSFIYQTHAAKRRSGPSPAQIEKAKSFTTKKEEVLSWLTSINLEEYFEDFVSEGFDDMRSIVALDEADLTEMGLKKGHRKRFLSARDKHLEAHRDLLPKRVSSTSSTPKPKPDSRPSTDRGISGNWSEGPTRQPLTRDHASTMLERLRQATVGKQEDERPLMLAKSIPKRPESMPPAANTTLQSPPMRAVSVPIQGTPTAAFNSMQMQYLAQLQQLQQAGMLQQLFSLGTTPALPPAVPAFQSTFSSPTSYNADWGALLASLAGATQLQPAPPRTPPPSMVLPSSMTSSSPSSTFSSMLTPSSTSSKASTFKLNPQAAAFKPSRPIASPSPPDSF
eukprot:GGOE01023645.1.p1 GENE.GGOE01023645.1~~GGOE01023645.1.p1  ORF type:complete len:1010 (-),score=236.24 GGOE01023645.1:385-3414(-)